MNLIDENPDPSFWRAIMRVYGFPFVMFTLAFVPGLSFTYLGTLESVGSFYRCASHG
jgi:hypothetical protein